jgi:hypothetical protein
MTAIPLTPGKAYRVKHGGKTIDVLARHGCEAIVAVLAFLGAFPC